MGRPHDGLQLLISGGSGWISEKGSSPEGSGHGTGSVGQWAGPQAAGAQREFVQCSQM